MGNQQADTHRGDILIVDDDLSSLNILTSMLTAEGYEVRGVPDGSMALTVIETQPPELVLLDIQMPGMDGFEICRKIKSEETSSDIPILFLSGRGETQDKVKAFETGAVDYITKPFQAEEVLARVDTHISLSRLHRNLEQKVKERTAELKKKEKQLLMMKHTVDDATDGIAWIAPDGRYLYVNEAGCRNLNYSAEKLLSMSVSDIDPNYPQDKWHAHYRELKRKGHMRLQTELEGKKGQRHHVDIHSKYMKFGNNEFICSFARDITALKTAEIDLEERLAFEQLIAEIAARLALLEPEHLDAAIDETLQRLSRFLKIERAFLGRFSEDGARLVFTNIWPAEDRSNRSDIFNMDMASSIPWVLQHIRRNRVIKAGPGLTGLPDEAWQLREQLEKDGITSGLVVPIRVEDEVIGLLGLDTIEHPRHYPQSVVNRLTIVADMIGSTLQRVHSQNSLQQYQHIVESTTSIVGMVDKNYVYQYVNDAYCNAFGKDRQEIIGSSVADFFEQQFFEQTIRPHYDRCFAGERVAYQAWGELAGWGHRYLDVRYSPFFDVDGNVSAAVVSGHDITGTKLLELKLAESEERFRAFMDNNPASIYIKDEKDIHIYCNQTAAQTKNMKPDEFIGMTTRDIFPTEIAERLIALDREVIEGDTPRIIEEFKFEKDGNTQWLRDIKFPIKLASGKTLLGGIAIDITEIKKNEQRLQEAYEKIEKLKQKLEQENIYLREEIELRHQHEEIIGKSKPVQEMLARVEKVAGTDATVLILGETGTGKELLANEIHRLSRRKGRTMIKVNCAALPATLIESELFGREKGAYTGAMSRQIGRFDIANGSTLFLDEIGEMPLELQAKLLRVLQEGQFERLGSPESVSTDVRIITSTNRDLAKAVSEGKFREDLYYRLNVFSVTVPPLRDRVDDIPLLVWALVKEYESSMGKTIHTISQSSLDALRQYAWPGNIRELKNTVENAMILSSGKTLHITPPIDQSVELHKAIRLEDVERDHIKGVLKETSWRVSGKNGAAELLGLKPTTLASRMKKLDIRRPK